MKLRMGGQTFVDVTIPVLWGTRALIQDPSERISVIDLAGSRAQIEILADRPAPRIRFVPTFDGFTVLGKGRKELYSYSPSSKTFTSLGLDLPSCQIQNYAIRVGGNVFSGGFVSGSRVGILITKDEVAVGAPLPSTLADLVI